jgi:hypothetical protein
VTSAGKRNDHATALVKCSTSYSAGPLADERPLSGKTTPHLGATKQSKQTSVGSLNDSKILEILLRTPLSAVFVRAHQRTATNSWQMNSTALAIATNAWNRNWHAELISPQHLCPHYSCFIVLRGTMMHVRNGCEMWQRQPKARRLCLISSC